MKDIGKNWAVLVGAPFLEEVSPDRDPDFIIKKLGNKAGEHCSLVLEADSIVASDAKGKKVLLSVSVPDVTRITLTQLAYNVAGRLAVNKITQPCASFYMTDGSIYTIVDEKESNGLRLSQFVNSLGVPVSREPYAYWDCRQCGHQNPNSKSSCGFCGFRKL